MIPPSLVFSCYVVGAFHDARAFLCDFQPLDESSHGGRGGRRGGRDRGRCAPEDVRGRRGRRVTWLGNPF